MNDLGGEEQHRAGAAGAAHREGPAADQDRHGFRFQPITQAQYHSVCQELYNSRCPIQSKGEQQ